MMGLARQECLFALDDLPPPPEHLCLAVDHQDAAPQPMRAWFARQRWASPGGANAPLAATRPAV